MAVCEDLCPLQFVPDWFVMPKLVEMWDDNDFDGDNDHELQQWYDGYKKYKKAQTFDAVELCVVTLNGKSWACTKEVWKVLKCNQTADTVKTFCY